MCLNGKRFGANLEKGKTYNGSYLGSHMTYDPQNLYGFI